MTGTLGVVDVLGVMDVLTARQAEVLKLRYVDGISTDRAIGEHLGVCRAAVTRRRLRGLDRLRSAGFDAGDMAAAVRALSEVRSGEVPMGKQVGWIGLDHRG